MLPLQFHLTHLWQQIPNVHLFDKNSTIFYDAVLNCFANHSILCLGLWISTTGKKESRSGRDCRHTDPHVKQTCWAGSSYRAGSSSQWKPCHTLIMHRFAKSACSQEEGACSEASACWTSSGSLAHQFCIFNTSDDSVHCTLTENYGLRLWSTNSHATFSRSWKSLSDEVKRATSPTKQPPDGLGS